jgi:hypothetical protein
MTLRKMWAEYMRRGLEREVRMEERGLFAFYCKTNDAKIKTHGVAGRVSKERNEAATGPDGTRHSRWIRVFFSSGRRVFDLVCSVGCEFQNPQKLGATATSG